MNVSQEWVSGRVVAWQASHGRNHLPWQQTRDPYRVWLSEIMLQQTQVSTVLDYYTRFLDRFPDVQSLALAPADEVMALWSGLGYYSRARNLHRCAQIVMSEHGGKFPATAQALATLPGIGRSTAGAIAAFCFSQRAAILDANVRRVLTRFLGFDKDLASAKNERLLWDLAELLLPTHDLETAMPRYTQGLMDLGATVCTPKTPHCESCPLNVECQAFSLGNPELYPVKTRKLTRRSESWHIVIIRNTQGQVWLQRRPPTGIWSGMHCVPVFADENPVVDFITSLGEGPQWSRVRVSPFLSVLRHRRLHLHPVVIRGAVMDRPTTEGDWLGPEQWALVGLPTPIRKLLDETQAQLW